MVDLQAVYALTRRQRDVLRLLGRGLTDRQIAQELALSERTVRHFVSGVLAALGARSRTHAAVMAVCVGLVPFYDLPGPQRLHTQEGAPAA